MPGADRRCYVSLPFLFISTLLSLWLVVKLVIYSNLSESLVFSVVSLEGVMSLSR